MSLIRKNFTQVWDQLRGVETMAEVCNPVFVDPENRKLMA